MGKWKLRGRRTMTIDGHRKGSKVSHRKVIDEKFYRELDVMKVQLNVLMELLQESGEDQKYRWILQKNMKWKLLQVKLR
jgi:hypothetical protein